MNAGEYSMDRRMPNGEGARAWLERQGMFPTVEEMCSPLVDVQRKEIAQLRAELALLKEATPTKAEGISIASTLDMYRDLLLCQSVLAESKKGSWPELMMKVNDAYDRVTATIRKIEGQVP